MKEKSCTSLYELSLCPWPREHSCDIHMYVCLRWAGAGQARCLPRHDGYRCSPPAELIHSSLHSMCPKQPLLIVSFQKWKTINGWVSSSMTEEWKARQTENICVSTGSVPAVEQYPTVEVGIFADTLISCLIISTYTSLLHFPLALSFSWEFPRFFPTFSSQGQ